MFENLSKPIKEDRELDERLKTAMSQHLQSLETVFKRYFFELKENETAFVRNQFSTALDVNDILDEYQTNFMILKMIRPHVMFFRKWLSLNSGVLCANLTHSRVSLS